MRRLLMLIGLCAVIILPVEAIAQQPATKKKALPPLPAQKQPAPKKEAKTATPAKQQGASAAKEQAPSPSTLTAQLADRDAQVRHRAADALADMGSKARSAVPALAKALGHEDAITRWRAARALAEIGADAAAATDALAARLTDKDPLVRANAARALGLMGKAANPAVPMLIKATTDDDAHVRRAAISAIARLRPGPQVVLPLYRKALEDAQPSVIMPALDSLAELGDAAVPVLVEALKSDKARYWAILVLAELGPKAAGAVPPLTAALADAQPQIRMQAAIALGEIGPDAKPAVPALIKAFQDKELSVRYGAAYALGKIATKDAAAALEKGLMSDDPMLKLLSAWGLAQISPDDPAVVKRAMDAILAALKSDNPKARAGAVRALVELKAPSELVGPALEQAIDDIDPDVVAQTVEALVAQGKKAVPRVANGLKREKLRPYALHVLKRLGPEASQAVPQLVEALKQADDPLLRREIHFTLAAIGPSSALATPELIKTLENDELKEIHGSVCYALGKIGPAADEAMPALREMLERGEPLQKMAAAYALRQIKPDDRPIGQLALPLFVQGLSHEMELVRSEAARAIGALGAPGPAAIEALKKAAEEDESAAVRQAAAEALKKLEAKE